MEELFYIFIQKWNGLVLSGPDIHEMCDTFVELITSSSIFFLFFFDKKSDKSIFIVVRIAVASVLCFFLPVGIFVYVWSDVFVCCEWCLGEPGRKSSFLTCFLLLTKIGKAGMVIIWQLKHKKKNAGKNAFRNYFPTQKRHGVYYAWRVILLPVNQNTRL